MRRFSEAEKQTIWDMPEAGVPVKRIARHLGRQPVTLRKFIADVRVKRPTGRNGSIVVATNPMAYGAPPGRWISR